MTATKEPLTMTLAEACAELQLSYRSALKMVKADTFPVPVKRIGKQMRISRRALLAYLEGSD